MRTHRYSTKGYSIDYSTNTIKMNYKFAKSAQDFGSPEYVLLKQIKADFPEMTTVVEAGRKIETTKLLKRVTYANMREHMSAYANSEELISYFDKVVFESKPLASPYKYVCDWFNLQFPEFRNPNLSFRNAIKGIPIVGMPDISNYTLKEENNYA